MRTAPTVIALAFSLTACAIWSRSDARAIQGPSFDEPFTLAPGASVVVGADRVGVRFVEVSSDSRCPRDAQCIRAGEALVRASVAVPGSDSQRVDLSTASKAGSVRVGGYRLALTALTPEPETSKPIAPRDYRATFSLGRD